MSAINEKQISAVLKLDGPKRFSHFVKRVVDFEEAWGLWSDGWVLMANNDGVDVFPLWPAREYAELSQTNDWASCECRPITLSALLDDLLPKMQERGVLSGVFPTPLGKGVIIPASELADALRRVDEENYG